MLIPMLDMICASSSLKWKKKQRGSKATKLVEERAESPLKLWLSDDYRGSLWLSYPLGVSTILSDQALLFFAMSISIRKTKTRFLWHPQNRDQELLAGLGGHC